jgi:hypothetical protein
MEGASAKAAPVATSARRLIFDMANPPQVAPFLGVVAGV